jgi:hypothetical protein
MSGSAGGGDNYVGMPDEDVPFQVDPTTASWMAGHTGTPIWDGSGNWDMTGPQSWWQRNTPDPATLAQINQMRGALTALKPLPDPNAAQVSARFPAIPAVPAAGLHPAQGSDAIAQYVAAIQQRQQAYRSQFMPKVTGLLGG